jgi:hypothetical protein
LRVLPFTIYVDQAVFTVVVVICSYLGHKYYSFAATRGTDASATPSHDPTAAPKD